ncbi:thioredoxin family protein [Limnochorda pilosa]|uniref:Redox-active disulfide protein 2 n=1 Tax=Limnochorda pilosa TaxID=1555112 RepID=A0A0K2SJT1_LIMPI|nr:thioredoxin family protein [Limnochorda pilosa]BAS27371.1 redox-active disulfide protein 2 [Limnochorda pilosa]
MRIEILGSGCPKCRATERIVREQLQTLGLTADVVHVTDPQEMRKYQVVFTPAVVVDGRVVSSGHVPTGEEVSHFLGA